MFPNKSFKTDFQKPQRIKEACNALSRYPDRLPIICERAKNAAYNCPFIDKRKYLVPKDLTIGQFLYVIRKRLHLQPEYAIFLFVNDYIPSNTHIISDLYAKYKDEDQFLYITYSSENVFG